MVFHQDDVRGAQRIVIGEAWGRGHRSGVCGIKNLPSTFRASAGAREAAPAGSIIGGEAKNLTSDIAAWRTREI